MLFTIHKVLLHLMTVKLVQLRAVIGIFNCRNSAIPHHECNLTQIFVSMFEVLL